MSSNINVLQVIPRLGHGGAETGCYDIAHYLSENNCKSFIVTSGGELIFGAAQTISFGSTYNGNSKIVILIPLSENLCEAAVCIQRKARSFALIDAQDYLF